MRESLVLDKYWSSVSCQQPIRLKYPLNVQSTNRYPVFFSRFGCDRYAPIMFPNNPDNFKQENVDGFSLIKSDLYFFSEMPSLLFVEY